MGDWKIDIKDESINHEMKADYWSDWLFDNNLNLSYINSNY